ncbi:MAG: hypothetical protein QXS54_11500 [Candidatus Methanomethylicaceae archaeon]
MDTSSLPPSVSSPHSEEIDDLLARNASFHLHIQLIAAVNTIFGAIGSFMLLLLGVLGFLVGLVWLNQGQEMLRENLLAQLCGGLVIFAGLPFLFSIFFLLSLPEYLLLLISGIGLWKRQFWARVLSIGLAVWHLLFPLAFLINPSSQTTQRFDNNMFAPSPTGSVPPIFALAFLLLFYGYNVYALVILFSQRANSYFLAGRRKVRSPA